MSLKTSSCSSPIFTLAKIESAGIGRVAADGGVESLTLVVLPLGVWRAHRHDVRGHRRVMIFTFAGALVIAGLFTLLPGRIMHAVVFGH